MTAPARLRGLGAAARRLHGGAPVRFATSAAGAVALTFDDGPDPLFTPQVLGLLSDLGVPATFFLLGRHAAMHPGLAREVEAEGHTIGSHSWSHPRPWTLSPPGLWREYRDGRRAVEEALHRRVRLFRPPNGYIDRTGRAVATALGLRPWVWSCDPGDYVPGVTTEAVRTAAGGAGEGAVVLLHDGMPADMAAGPEALDRSATVAAIEAVVTTLRARGLRLVRLDDE